MSDFVHVNLMDLDDSVSSRVPEIEGRFGRTTLESRDLGVSHFRYAPNFKSENGHRHREQEEAYIVIAGGGQMLVNDEVLDLKLLDVVRVSPEAKRAFHAGPEGLEYIAVGGPKPEGGDGEQVKVEWPE